MTRSVIVAPPSARTAPATRARRRRGGGARRRGARRGGAASTARRGRPLRRRRRRGGRRGEAERRVVDADDVDVDHDVVVSIACARVRAYVRATRARLAPLRGVLGARSGAPVGRFGRERPRVDEVRPAERDAVGDDDEPAGRPAPPLRRRLRLREVVDGVHRGVVADGARRHLPRAALERHAVLRERRQGARDGVAGRLLRREDHADVHGEAAHHHVAEDVEEPLRFLPLRRVRADLVDDDEDGRVGGVVAGGVLATLLFEAREARGDHPLNADDAVEADAVAVVEVRGVAAPRAELGAALPVPEVEGGVGVRGEVGDLAVEARALPAPARAGEDAVRGAVVERDFAAVFVDAEVRDGAPRAGAAWRARDRGGEGVEAADADHGLPGGVADADDASDGVEGARDRVAVERRRVDAAGEEDDEDFAARRRVRRDDATEGLAGFGAFGELLRRDGRGEAPRGGCARRDADLSLRGGAVHAARLRGRGGGAARRDGGAGREERRVASGGVRVARRRPPLGAVAEVGGVDDRRGDEGERPGAEGGAVRHPGDADDEARKRHCRPRRALRGADGRLHRRRPGDAHGVAAAAALATLAYPSTSRRPAARRRTRETTVRHSFEQQTASLRCRGLIGPPQPRQRRSGFGAVTTPLRGSRGRRRT